MDGAQRGLLCAARLALRVGLRPIKLAAPICRSPDPRMFGRKSGRSEITRENTSVTYVFATTNFYGAAKRIRSPEPRIVRGTKVATVVPSCQNIRGTYMIEITGKTWCRKEDSNP
jgi:hypothetical protein